MTYTADDERADEAATRAIEIVDELDRMEKMPFATAWVLPFTVPSGFLKADMDAWIDTYSSLEDELDELGYTR